jgi:predicted transcriptional regulator
VDEFFARSRERARKLDRGERMPVEIRVVFEDPADLMQVLSTERIRVLQAVRTRRIPVSQLASDLKRDRQAVMRDVRLLESFGLLKTRDAPNPGNGRRRIVAPLAARYQLVANI